MDTAAPDKTFAYHAPQYKESEQDDKDKFFQGAHLADYGLKAFAQVYEAAASQVKTDTNKDDLNVEAFYNIYFELTDKLKATTGASRGDKVKLQTPTSVEDYVKAQRFTELKVKAGGVDIIMIDIHPNDATKAKIASNEVGKLIKDIFEAKKDEATFKLTVIVDIT